MSPPAVVIFLGAPRFGRETQSRVRAIPHISRGRKLLLGRNAKIFRVRMADFKRQARPLVSYCRDLRCLMAISGDRKIEIVGQEILAAYDQFEAA